MRFDDMDGFHKSVNEYAAFLLDYDAVVKYLHKRAEYIAAKCGDSKIIEPLADEITELAIGAFGMGCTAREIQSIQEKSGS